MKKTYKRALTLLVVLAMSVGLCFGLAACGGSGQSEEQMIRTELDKQLSVMKSPTQDDLKAIIGDDIPEADEFAMYGINPYEMLQHVFKHFDYKIDGVKVDGDKATATITLTNADIQAIAIQFANDIQNDEELINAVTEALVSEGEQAAYKIVFDKLYLAIDESDNLVTSTVDLQLEKKDGKWSYTEESYKEFLEKAFGGMSLASLI